MVPVRPLPLLAAAVLASGCADHGADPYGSASVAISEVSATGVDTSPFVASFIRAGAGRQCSGRIPGISKGSCFHYLSVEVEAEGGRRLLLKVASEPVAGDEQARRVEADGTPVVRWVELSQGEGARIRSWSESKVERATVSVAPDGRVTYDVAGVLGVESTDQVRIEASITIECEAGEPNVAICLYGSGPPRS